MVAFATPALARAEPPITIAFDARSIPTQYIDSTGTVAGIYPAIVRRAFKIVGQPVIITALPFRRATEGLAADKMGAGALVETSRRLQQNDYSVAYAAETLSVYHLASRALEFRSLTDFSNRSVGAISGWAYDKTFERARAAGRFRVQEVESDVLNFKKLKAERIDFAVATTLSGAALVALPEFRGIAAGPSELTTIGVHIAFNKRAGRQALVERLNAVIAQLQANGELSAIAAREAARAPAQYKFVLRPGKGEHGASRPAIAL